jgi:ribosome-associated protein
VVMIDEDLEIPDAELTFTTSRSGGPGGQNVNKLDTRVTLLFDVDRSVSLSCNQRDRLHERLSGRIGKNGLLRVVSQKHRTQYANRQEALRRFAALVASALADEEVRVPTRVPASVNERRMEAKRHRGRLKRGRANVEEEE